MLACPHCDIIVNRGTPHDPRCPQYKPERGDIASAFQREDVWTNKEAN